VTSRWIALLRAVNLGPRNKVPMAELRRLFEEAGAEEVRTWIQSGNVVFAQTKPDAAKLEAAIERELGVKTVLVLRSAQQMRKLARSHPFGSDTSSSHVAFFVEKPSAAALREVARLDIGDNKYEMIGSDVALYYPTGFQGATLTTAKLEKILGIPGTARNWRTVEKLTELAG
jgi:uncharacterized protein (DUF1697 family)